jgi:multidrug efflux pump subunit AcrB
MWIVRFALQRPYTFVIVAVLIAIFGASAIVTTPTDILPDINIPIVSVIWTYSGLDADDMSKRIVGVCERAIPTTVNNVQYTESQSFSGVGVIKVHFQPSVQVDLAIAQVTALGSGGEQNAPIGRAVIGGLLFATVGTLLIVPVFYSLFSKSVPVNWEKRLDDETQGAFK